MWFKVTFLSPTIWRSLGFWKGHVFTIPKRAPAELPAYTLPETNIAPEYRPSQKEASIPTMRFFLQVGRNAGVPLRNSFKTLKPFENNNEEQLIGCKIKKQRSNHIGFMWIDSSTSCMRSPSPSWLEHNQKQMHSEKQLLSTKLQFD